jgi:hypothetical protein
MAGRRRLRTGIGILLSVMAAWTGVRGDTARCQILDNLYEPVYRFRLGAAPRSRFGGRGRSSLIELDADWEMGYLRHVFGGEMDIHSRMRNVVFPDPARIALPLHMMALALDAGWTVRLGEGRALQFRGKPGLYGNFDTLNYDGFFAPFSFCFLKAFHRDLSGEAGLEIRPGFGHAVVPILGFKWEPFPWLGLEPRIPRSRITWFAAPEWSVYLAYEWRSDSYALDDARRMATLTDHRLYGGIGHRLSDRMEISLEAGRLRERKLKFKKGGSYDVQSATFMRIGIGGPF